jgi:Ca2+ transporting ATPase
MASQSSVKASDFKIRPQELDQLVNGWKQREKGDEDIQFYQKQGGKDWLVNGLKTSAEEGINTASTPAREEVYGNNKKKVIAAKTFWFFVEECLEDRLLRVLIIAGIFSMMIDVIMAEPSQRSHAWIEGFAILLAVILITVVTALNNLKKEKEFRKLNDEAEKGKFITLVRNGQVLPDQSIESVLVGDLVVIRSGMENPGDAIVIEGFSIQMDESSMTGESDPMIKDTLENCLAKKEEILKKNPNKKLEHHDLPSPVVIAGTKVLSGSGKMLIVAVGPRSSIGKINQLIQGNEDELTPLQLKLEKMARDIGTFGTLAAIVLILALVIRWGVENSLNDGSGWKSTPVLVQVHSVLTFVLMGVAILVMAIPEGLPLAVTLSLAYSVGKMMDEKNLVRKLEACETMGGANIICSDKTGTLTKNEMYLTHFWSGSEVGVYNTVKETYFNYKEFIASKETQDLFVNTIVLNSLEDPTAKRGNPTEMAMLKYLHGCGVEVLKLRASFKSRFQATFTSDRKRMSTVVDFNGKTYVFIKGASEYILELSDSLLNLKDNKTQKIDKGVKTNIEAAIESMAKKALRTIGVAFKEVKFEELNMDAGERGIFDWEKSGFTLVGVCGIKDVIRPEVPGSIEKCRTAGIDVKMVTGDNKITAEAIAREIGIIRDQDGGTKLVMEGPEFLRLIGGVIQVDDDNVEVGKDDEKAPLKPKEGGKKRDTIKNAAEFDRIWKNLAVLARSRPEDKYALVTGLKERGNVVAVTGDGTNDAPALSKADVGFAMNIAGTEVAKKAADILLMDDNFASIVVAAKWGRNIYDSIRKFLTFQLTVNVSAVTLTFFSCVYLNESVLSTVQILWINLIMDTFAALALATEPPSEELLKRKPQSKDDYIISPLMYKQIVVQAFYQVLVMMIFVFVGPSFLPDVVGRRQLQPGKDTIVSGFQAFGYNPKNYGGQFSVHATYNFNVFVVMQIANLFNCRVLDNHLNIFKDLTKSPMFLFIISLITLAQVIFITLCGPAIKVVQWGLDPYGWAICIAFGVGEWVFAFIFKFIPIEAFLPGAGKEVISKEQLNRTSTIGIRRTHDEKFFKRNSIVVTRDFEQVKNESAI